MAVDIAKLGVSIDTSDVQKAKADLQAIVPVADLVERAALKLAKADQARAKAALEAAKASGTATKEQLQALAASVKDETAKVKQAKAAQTAATAAVAVAQATKAVERATTASTGSSQSNATALAAQAAAAGKVASVNATMQAAISGAASMSLASAEAALGEAKNRRLLAEVTKQSIMQTEGASAADKAAAGAALTRADTDYKVAKAVYDNVKAREDSTKAAQKAAQAEQDVAQKKLAASQAEKDAVDKAAQAEAAHAAALQKVTAVTEQSAAALSTGAVASNEAAQAALATAKADFEVARITKLKVLASGESTKADIAAANAAEIRARAALAEAEAIYKSSVKTESALDRMGTAANDNLNAVQATPANIAAQFQDIGVTAAAGMNPMLIALQQGTQLSVAFSGGLGGIGAALKQVFSPMSILTIAAVALIAYLIQLAMGFFNTGDAAKKASDAYEKLKFASDGVADAQSVLGKLFDIHTGKLKENTAEAILNAKAQLLVAEAMAKARAQEARSAASGAYSSGFFEMNTRYKQSAFNRIVSPVLNAKTPEERTAATAKAMDELDRNDNRKLFGEETILKATTALSNYNNELLNAVTHRKALGDISSGKLSAEFIDPKKAKAASKAKTPAQKFSDIVTGAEGDIAKMEAENSLIGKKGDLYTRAVFEQELLNKANAAHLTLTDAQKTKVAELAESMARLKREGDSKKFYADMDADATKQIATLTMQGKAIGVYGAALYKLQEVQRLRTAAEAAGVTVTDELNKKIDEQASKVAKLTAANDNTSFMESVRLQYESATDSLMQQINALGLYGEAAKKATIEAKLLAEAKAKNIQLTEAQAAEISQMAASQASYEQQLENLTKINDAVKEIGKSFVTDFIGKVREGANVWDALGEAATNVLNKITDKVLDMALNAAFASMGGGGGGILSALFSAKGNAFTGGAGAAAFANGGAFTNSVVNSTTPFKFGNGGSKLGIMGEAGPEAVMPLTRGADGSLGVQMYGANSSGGGGAMAVNVNVTNNHTLSGAISSEDVVKLNKASAEQTKREMKAQLPQIINQYKRDGSIAA